MYDFLFFFPRARAALRQVPECITVRVTMAPSKASCPGFWALCPNTSHSIHYDPITALLGFLRSYPQTANWRWFGMLGPCQNVAHSLGFIRLRQKSVKASVLRDEIISRRCRDEGGVVVSQYARGVLLI